MRSEFLKTCLFRSKFSWETWSEFRLETRGERLREFFDGFCLRIGLNYRFFPRKIAISNINRKRFPNQLASPFPNISSPLIYDYIVYQFQIHTWTAVWCIYYNLNFVTFSLLAYFNFLLCILFSIKIFMRPNIAHL